jgi:hypothetical protein
MSELVKKVNAACAFGTPDAEITREIVGEVQALIAERDRLRTALEKIATEHAPMVPPEGHTWLGHGKEGDGRREHCRGCDTGDPYDATPWSECLAGQVAREALDG